MDQLPFDVQGSGGVLDCPLLLIQVTRLLCGGFVFALRLNHTVCDAIGLAQFMSAVAELSRGLPSPTVTPAWSHELLEARRPPKPALPHREFDAVPVPPPPPPGDMVMRTFTFGPTDVTAIKNGLPPNLRDKATSFEALTAAFWRARAPAGRGGPAGGHRQLQEPARAGSACVPAAALTTAGALLADAVERVRAASTCGQRSTTSCCAGGRAWRWRTCSSCRTTGTSGGASFLVAVKNGCGEDAVAVPVVHGPVRVAGRDVVEELVPQCPANWHFSSARLHVPTMHWSFPVLLFPCVPGCFRATSNS